MSTTSTIYCMKVRWAWFVLPFFLFSLLPLTAWAQEPVPQNKPYIDLRPLHFGISVGLNMQDVEMRNVGPQIIDMPEVGETEQCVVGDADTWNPGFSVGVLADMRLSQHLSLRISPTMHFGAKHLTFRNLRLLDEFDRPVQETQDLKNTYISVPIDLKFSAQRFNNYRPYMVAGISPMINLASKDQDFICLKRYDTMVEVGLGCDFYLPYFKLIPELKFCFGLHDVFDKDHVNSITDGNKQAYARSISQAQSKMIVLTFYFE